MLVRYWQPWHEMETLRRQLDNVFGDLTQTEPTRTPAVEVKDMGNDWLVRVQLPGLDAKDIDIQATQDAVVITAERSNEQKTEDQGYFKSEFYYGKFYRVVNLPTAVQNDQVKAEYKDGVLNLTLPKVVEARNKVVKVNLVEASEVTEA